MLFAAGIGIDLLFFCVAEPLSHYLAPPDMAPESAAAMRAAVPQTFLHWGLTGWGMYVLMGMALAYFSYRHRLPLAIRSALFPLLGKRIHGPIGSAVDITAVISTVFGIATSLGIGVMQLNYGLTFMFGVPESLSTQVVLIVLVVILATISVVTGVEKASAVFPSSTWDWPPCCCCSCSFRAIRCTCSMPGAQRRRLPERFRRQELRYLCLRRTRCPAVEAGGPSSSGLVDCLDALRRPLPGPYLAWSHHSRIRHRRLLIPLGFMMAWMSIFGNSGIEMVANQDSRNSARRRSTRRRPPSTPSSSSIRTSVSPPRWSPCSASCSSSPQPTPALVLANFTSILSDVNHDAPIRLRIFWSVAIGLVTVALLMAGGLSALQSAVVITAVPFSLVIFAIMAGMTRP